MSIPENHNWNVALPDPAIPHSPDCDDLNAVLLGGDSPDADDPSSEEIDEDNT